MQQTVVVIGNFDGVHRGHQALIKLATRRAHELAAFCQAGGSPVDLRVVVVTFWPHPVKVLAPDRAPKLLTGLEERIELLKRAGAHEVRVVQFNREVAAWSPSAFVDTILMPMHPALVVVGENFRFGRGASGSVQTLRQLGTGRFDVEALPLVQMDDEDTNSSVIRAELSAGDVAAAARHLGRWFQVQGVVVVGDQRGRRLGFPTANLPVSIDLAMPADGVYAGWLTRLDEPASAPMPAAISVGTNPTFDGVERRVESYVLDRTDLELYGVEIAVAFVAHLRGQLRFDSVAALVAQMNRDVAAVRTALGEDSRLLQSHC